MHARGKNITVYLLMQYQAYLAIIKRYFILYSFTSKPNINSVLLQLSIRFCCNYQFGSAAIINSVLLQLSIRFCCSYQFGSAAFINLVRRRCSRKNRLQPKRASFKRHFLYYVGYAHAGKEITFRNEHVTSACMRNYS